MNEPINKSMSQSFAKLEEQLEKAMAVQTAMILFNETLAPREAAERTARVIGSLSGQYLDIITGETVKKLLKQCRKEEELLTQTQRAVVREVEEELEKLQGIPADEYRKFAELTARATGIWADARKKKRFDLFAPVLKEIVDYQKRFASYREKFIQLLHSEIFLVIV